MPSGVEEYVLRLDVTVGNALRVEVGDAGEHLYKAALDLCWGHGALLDGSIEIAAGTILHDLAPIVIFVLNEVDGLDDIGMVQGGGDAEL